LIYFVLSSTVWAQGSADGTQPLAKGELSAAELKATLVPKDIQVTEKLDGQLPLNLVFKDEDGTARNLKHYFDGRQPVLLVPVYYACPLLCNITLNRLVGTLRDLPWSPGAGYRILALTIDPREKPELAKAKKAIYLKELGRPAAEYGWHFLTGDGKAIKSLTAAVGFGYRYDPKRMEYLHRAAVIVLSPTGKITRYFHGAYTPPIQLKISLIKAANGTLGSKKERLWAFLFAFDATTKKYVLDEGMILSAIGLMVLFLVGLVVMGVRRRRAVRAVSAASPPN